MKKIIRFCGSEDYRKSGVGYYSDTYIRCLKEKGLTIIDKWIPIKDGYLRLIYQFVILPIKISLFYRKEEKIFRDEGMLIYTLFPFFPTKKCIYIVHDIRDFNLSTEKKSLLQKIYFYLIRKSYKNLRKVKKIITPSEFTKKNIVDMFGVNESKIGVVYSSFDLNKFKPLKEKGIKEALFKKYNITTPNKILLNVGSEESRKNIITILKSLKELKEYSFIKIGRPIINKNRESHLRYIKENNLGNRVHFIDYIDDVNDLIKFYNVVDIFVFPSLFEGFGRPPIEAQACGCPVISSDKGGLKEVIGNSCGILKNPESTEELINKILELNNDKAKSYIKSGFINIKRFEQDINVEKFYRILNNK